MCPMGTYSAPAMPATMQEMTKMTSCTEAML